jgi:hypothetical protein
MARKPINKSAHTSGDGQKRLMAESVGEDSEHWISRPVQITAGDYGCDPAGDGMFRMVPSGDVVNYAERCRRLTKYERR